MALINALSPGVYVREVDLTTIVPGVGTTEGAFAGDFVWGPVNTIVTVSNEDELVATFGKPDSNTFKSFFTAANFLAYANNLKVVRTANTAAANNATAYGNGVLIENRDKYEENYLDLSDSSYGMFAARYPGDLGNSLKVSLWAGSNSSQYSSWAYAKEFNGVPGTSAYATNAKGSNDEMHIIVIDENGQFSGGIANTVLEKFSYLSKASDATNDDGSSNYYVNVINDRSRYVYIMSHANNAQLESSKQSYRISGLTLNAAGNNYSNGTIVFEGGNGSGAAGNITVNGTSSIVAVTLTAAGIGYLQSDTATINLTSRIANSDANVVANMAFGNVTVTSLNVATETANWGNIANSRTFVQAAREYTASLANGASSLATNANLITAYDKFKNPEEIDISLIMTGAAPQVVSEHIVDNIAESRRDCVVFISPEYGDVVNQAGAEANNIIEYRNLFNSTSYAVMDNNWKYQFDKYNNVYRWVPLNGDIAGLCVRTDYDRDPWFSPAGFNRGQIKNVVKLAWNPTKANRDDLYRAGINSVVSFPGEGVVLFGDKTMLAKPSAFDRINVRRLFIVLEKAISRAAKYSLFEFNDEFTRAQFVSLVEPFLRDVQGRRGIFDFRVVCDTTNNTPEVIDRNEFIGDIYIKPARSINFIQLNFVAVRTGVAFEEVVGRF